MSGNQSILPVFNKSATELVLLLECYSLQYKYPLYGWQKYVHMGIPVFFALIWLPCVVLNVSALLVYFKKNMRRLLSNLFILNTILADLCTGLFVIPWVAWYYVIVAYFHELKCSLYLSLTIFGFVSTVVSFLMVSFSAIDRYLAVFKPFFYSAKLAHWSSLYYGIMATTWFFTVSIVGVSFYTPGFAAVLYFISGMVIVLFINVVMTIKLWLVVRRFRQAIHNQLSVHDSNTRYPRKTTRNSSYSVSSAQLPNTRNRSVRVKQENRKSTRVMMFMLLSLLLCYLPYLVISIVWQFAEVDLDIHNTMGSLASAFAVFKSVLNPIIYCYSMPSVKKRMKDVVFFWKEKEMIERSLGETVTIH